MFRASSAHLQEDTVVHVQHMVLSLSMRVLGDLSVQLSLKLCTDRPPKTLLTAILLQKVKLPPDHAINACRGNEDVSTYSQHRQQMGSE